MPSDVDKAPTLSVVISTYNRTKDLRVALESIVIQSSMPSEVIVVDDSDDDSTEGLVTSLRDIFISRGSELRYVKNAGAKSLTVARNLGAEESKGDVVSFLDDDVVLDKDYFSALLRVYVERPDAMGVQGFHGGNLDTSVSGLVGNAIDRAFMIWFYGRDTCRVMPSFSQTYPHDPSGTVRCQWLSGCNMSYRREVFAGLRFDDKLRRYSPGEDVDFSYRVWKHHPGSLFLTPYAKVEHRYAPSSRTPKRNLILIEMVYWRYLLEKNMDRTLRSKASFYWTGIGRIVTSLIRNAKAQLSGKLKEPCFLEARYRIEGLMLGRRRLRDLRKGDLGFMDRYFDY